MKKSILLLFILFLSGSTYAQQLSWKFANPRIIRLSAVDHLQFEIQVKSSVSATYLWAGQVKLNFNNTTFSTTSGNWAVTKGATFSGDNSSTNPKYTVTRTITGTSPNKVYNIALTGDANVSTNGGSASDFSEVPTDWTTFVTVSARLAIFTGDALAGIDFLESGMNGFEQYITGSNTFVNYTNPNVFDSRDFLASFTGRFYSTSKGWSQIGGGTDNVQYNNWGTSVSTTVWEDASISQTDKTAALANNVTIKNGSTTYPVLTIPAKKWLTVSGTLDSPGNSSLVVESDGSLIHNTNDVPGTIKRVVTGSTSLDSMKYHFVSVPLTSAASPTAALFLGSYLFDYDEASSGWNPLGSTTTTALDVTRGYMMYYAGGLSTTNSFAGPLNNGSFTALTSNSGDGYNLVPNPYPSAIGWLTGTWTKTKIDNAIYIWPSGAGASSGNYASYVGGVGNNGGTQFIPVGQSFFVHASGAPVLTMDNTVRAHDAQAFWKEGIPDLLRIQASANSATDEIAVRFTEDATPDFDSDWDAYKLQGGADAPQLSSIADDHSKLSINSLPPNESESVVPLNFSLNKFAEVVFTASGMESFNENKLIYLEDKVSGQMIDLGQNPVYIFSFPGGGAPDRFNLHFLNTTGDLNPLSISKGTAYIATGILNIHVPAMEGQHVCIKLFDLLGQQMCYRLEVMNGAIQVPVSLSIGIYVVKVTSGNQSFVAKVVNN
ncbi:MAG: T9SS type A sorting domain-containing protein [Bacteroidota bacterium]